jgi:hypothetical protein
MKDALAAILAALMMTAIMVGQQSSGKSKQADTAAKKFDAIRAEAKLPALHRAEPSVRESELVCTTALTGRRLGDPWLSGLDTYTTQDLSAETPVLKGAALGTTVCGSGVPSCDKKWPRYSVIVEENKNSTPMNPSYTVGIARRPSASLELFAPLFLDVPFKGMNDWKKQVAPECSKQDH